MKKQEIKDLRKMAEQKEKIKEMEVNVIRREILKATGGKKIVISLTEKQLNKIMTDCYKEGYQAKNKND